MAILKCKMCGGDIEVSADKTYGTCDSCGSTMTLPKIDDDQKANLYNRANHFRRQNEFDKALAIYEKMIGEDDSEAEAHWGAVLCRFGIEYVVDPASGKRVPTCHRASYDSILQDVDYLAALKHSQDVMAKKLYEDEANYIANVQKEIMSISNKETPYDVFICYKETDASGSRTKDSTLAQDVYYQLTQEGFKVFFSRITLEDKLGVAYEPYIFSALNTAKVMVVIGTKPEYFNAIWVKNEWSRYLNLLRKDKSRLLIPCYRDMDAYDIPEELSMLQSQDMSKIGFMQDLIRGIEKILTVENKEPKVHVITTDTSVTPAIDALLKRACFFLEDEEWQEATAYFNRVLDTEPECAKAYIGLLCARYNLTKESLLPAIILKVQGDKTFQKALRFADEDYNAQLEKYREQALSQSASLKAKVEERQRKEQQAKEEQAARLKEEQRNKEELATKLKEEQRSKEEEAVRAKINHNQKLTMISTYFRSVAINVNYKMFLNANGTVTATKIRILGDKKVCQNWTNMVSLSSGHDHVVGLRLDGTVLSEGKNSESQASTGRWTDIIAVSAGGWHTVGLKSDGTVIACGRNAEGQCNVQSWENIVAISAGLFFTLGLKKDGTVVGTSFLKKRSDSGQCEVESWKNIIAIYAGGDYSIGLKSDNTTVVAGKPPKIKGQSDVSNWKDIVAISASNKLGTGVAGLKADGTIIVTGNINQDFFQQGWKNMVDIYAGENESLTVSIKGILNNDSVVISDKEGKPAVAKEHIGYYNLIKDSAEIDACEGMFNKYLVARAFIQEKIGNDKI